MKTSTEQADADFDSSELRSLIDRNADGILVVDAAGRVQFANDAALALFGRGREHLLGFGLGLPFVAGETAIIDLIRPDGVALEVEMRVVETIWNGERALLASLRDISERRELEEQLRHAQKMEAVGRLTAGVAHDFNNLLTIVLGNLDTLRRRLPQDSADPRISRSVENATTGAMRAAELTQQLLAYSRRQPLTPRAVDLASLLRGMDDLLTRTLGTGVNLTMDVAPGTWPIIVDPSQLEAALINLAVNAKDAMTGGGALTIKARNCAEIDLADVAPGEYVRLSVSDTGTGIPVDVQAQVFDPFFTTKDVGKGTGLGLSQVYGFVKQSLGHVVLESAVGGGTSMHLYFPRHSGMVEQPSQRPAASAAAPSSRTVLLVEDEEDLREWARAVLGDLGYRVLEAATGPEALRILQSDQPLLLMFTDVSLPGGMDGRQLAGEAARLRPAMKTLMTTAYAGDVLVENGQLAAGTHLLSKPYTRTQLQEALESLLGRTSPDVLLVEDDPQVRQTLAESLRDLGVFVLEAATARTAIAMIRDREQPISVAIVDLELPDGRGIAVLEALKADRPGTIAIVASGYIGEEERERIEARQGVAILAKPFSGDELAKLLNELGILNRVCLD